MFYQIFLSRQVIRCVIIAYKHDIYELLNGLLKDLRKLENTRKVSKLPKMIA